MYKCTVKLIVPADKKAYYRPQWRLLNSAAVIQIQIQMQIQIQIQIQVFAKNINGDFVAMQRKPKSQLY